MPSTAPTLPLAAAIAYQNLLEQAAANHLSTKLTAYAAAMSPLFSDAIPNDRPVGNWLVPISAAAATCGVRGTITAQVAAADLVYRICWAAEAMFNAGFISSAQHVAALAAYNTTIGV